MPEVRCQVNALDPLRALGRVSLPGEPTVRRQEFVLHVGVRVPGAQGLHEGIICRGGEIQQQQSDQAQAKRGLDMCQADDFEGGAKGFFAGCAHEIHAVQLIQD